MESNDHCQAFLDFLNEDLLFGSEQLDAGTLAAVCAVETQHAQQSSTQRKRPRTASSPADDGIKDDPDDDRDSGEERLDSKRNCKQDPAKLARNKACREKARREKLNDRFSELAQLVEPGSEPKTDKLSIINDAIKYVTQMKVENSQLKQLNKFLEERTAQLEKERSQALYQQALLQGAAQQQASMHAAMLQQGAMMQQGGMMPGLGMAAPGLQPLAPAALQQLPQQQLLQPPEGMLMQPPGVMMQPPGMAAAYGMPLKQSQSIPEGLGAAGSAAAAVPAVAGAAAAGMGGVGGGALPNGYWVPPSMLDASRDSLLRPPAA